MNTDTKEGFLLYKSFYEPIKGLTLEEKGQLLDLIFQFQITGVTDVTTVTPTVKMAFEFIKNQFRLDDKKYTDFVELQREKGKKSAQKRWGNKVTEVTAANSVQPEVTEVTYKEKEKEKEKDKLNNYAGTPADDKKKE